MGDFGALAVAINLMRNCEPREQGRQWSRDRLNARILGLGWALLTGGRGARDSDRKSKEAWGLSEEFLTINAKRAYPRECLSL